MELPELLETILKGSKYLGTYSLADLLTFASSRHLNALAVAKDGKSSFYLAFHNGEPEGAICLDPEGALFGDKAVVHIRSGRNYVLCDVREDIIESLAMGCPDIRKIPYPEEYHVYRPGDWQEKRGDRCGHLKGPPGKTTRKRCPRFDQKRRQDRGERYYDRKRRGEFSDNARGVYLSCPGPGPAGNSFSDLIR